MVDHDHGCACPLHVGAGGQSGDRACGRDPGHIPGEPAADGPIAAAGHRAADHSGHGKWPRVVQDRCRPGTADLALREIEDAIDEIDIAHGRARSRIAICVVPMCASPFLSRAVNDLLSEYPEARIVIEHGSYDELLDDLRSGRIDMLYGVLRLPAWVHDAKEEPLFENPYVIAVGRDHPLTGLKRLSLEHLAQHDWIAPKPGTPRRRCLQQMFEHAACSPRIAVETSSLHVQRALLTSSDRITLLTRQEMEQEASLGFLVTLPFFPPKTRAPDGLVTRSDWQRGFSSCFGFTVLDRICKSLPDRYDHRDEADAGIHVLPRIGVEIRRSRAAGIYDDRAAEPPMSRQNSSGGVEMVHLFCKAKAKVDRKRWKCASLRSGIGVTPAAVDHREDALRERSISEERYGNRPYSEWRWAFSRRSA
jgi:DNA-binding transcriptional LysR family regulator